MSFNPRPPSLAGDPAASSASMPAIICFNPRPPSLAGDPTHFAGDKRQADVSIRARHHWRAILAHFTGDKRQANVSIRARHHWRAIPDQGLLRGAAARFNPRPPSLAGDPAVDRWLYARCRVSIRARHHWRAIQS